MSPQQSLFLINFLILRLNLSVFSKYLARIGTENVIEGRFLLKDFSRPEKFIVQIAISYDILHYSNMCVWKSLAFSRVDISHFLSFCAVFTKTH